MNMWHSQILGSFEAKNITCVFLHENSNLAIEITKDVFPDDKKCKKVWKSGLKIRFCFSSPMAENDLVFFTPYVCYLEDISTMWATPYVVKSLN